MTECQKEIIDHLKNEILKDLCREEIKYFNSSGLEKELRSKGVEIYKVKKFNISTVDMESDEDFIRFLKRNKVTQLFLWEQHEDIEFSMDLEMRYQLSRLAEIFDLGDIDQLELEIKLVVKEFIDSIGDNIKDFAFRDISGVGYKYNPNAEINYYISKNLRHYIFSLQEKKESEVNELEEFMYDIAVTDGTEALYNYLITDPAFRRCTNAKLRQGYICSESFFDEVPSMEIEEANEKDMPLRSVWFMVHVHRRKCPSNSNVYYRYSDFYKRYMSTFENAWRKIRGK